MNGLKPTTEPPPAATKPDRDNTFFALEDDVRRLARLASIANGLVESCLCPSKAKSRGDLLDVIEVTVSNGENLTFLAAEITILADEIEEGWTRAFNETVRAQEHAAGRAS
ncbi:hypothetical protein [Prosthecomicrobium pneumaticum]|uniref:Uncharacterized protein n=1 Tax=Prosthecomicrobium pneumaticum TaxID=81895 RepID=A0A7W9FPB4_9HYPH|nr:hypothetical protein [Prosthecomicrobium pneumaticum]MBB5754349.1 hypothetical protein [Prosthecomicrobium pneumaticum]